MNKQKATYRHWLSEKISPDLQQQTQRLLHAKDIKHVRLMADAHLANDVCVGCVLATTHLIYPAAVGGDIGCGMLSIPFNMEASFIQGKHVNKIFTALMKYIPVVKQKNFYSFDTSHQLSSSKLQKIANSDGRLQLGTLGRGNHFLELQSCTETGQLWLMIHTGSRAMGPAIRDYHLDQSHTKSAGLKYLDVNSQTGQAYLHDMQWAREYAYSNRELILKNCQNIFKKQFSVSVDKTQMIHCDHNHIERLSVNNQSLIIHRKGACSVKKGGVCYYSRKYGE